MIKISQPATERLRFVQMFVLKARSARLDGVTLLHLLWSSFIQRSFSTLSSQVQDFRTLALHFCAGSLLAPGSFLSQSFGRVASVQGIGMSSFSQDIGLRARVVPGF